MKKIKLEKFGPGTVADAVSKSDLDAARSALVFAVGSFMDVSGKVQKVVKRDGQCKLVIEPGTLPGFVVFADCLSDAETVRNSKIRKGSLVSVRGRFLTFGRRALNLTNCRLQ